MSLSRCASANRPVPRRYPPIVSCCVVPARAPPIFHCLQHDDRAAGMAGLPCACRVRWSGLGCTSRTSSAAAMVIGQSGSAGLRPFDIHNIIARRRTIPTRSRRPAQVLPPRPRLRNPCPLSPRQRLQRRWGRRIAVARRQLQPRRSSPLTLSRTSSGTFINRPASSPLAARPRSLPAGVPRAHYSFASRSPPTCLAFSRAHLCPRAPVPPSSPYLAQVHPSVQRLCESFEGSDPQMIANALGLPSLPGHRTAEHLGGFDVGTRPQGWTHPSFARVAPVLWPQSAENLTAHALRRRSVHDRGPSCGCTRPTRSPMILPCFAARAALLGRAVLALRPARLPVSLLRGWRRHMATPAAAARYRSGPSAASSAVLAPPAVHPFPGACPDLSRSILHCSTFSFPAPHPREQRLALCDGCLTVQPSSTWCARAASRRYHRASLPPRSARRAMQKAHAIH